MAFSTFVSICFAIFVTTSLLLFDCSRTSERGKFPRGSGLNTKQPLAVEILLQGFWFKPGWHHIVSPHELCSTASEDAHSTGPAKVPAETCRPLGTPWHWEKEVGARACYWFLSSWLCEIGNMLYGFGAAFLVLFCLLMFKKKKRPEERLLGRTLGLTLSHPWLVRFPAGQRLTSPRSLMQALFLPWCLTPDGGCFRSSHLDTTTFL